MDYKSLQNVLEDWFKFSGYDKDQKEFNLLSYGLMLHLKNERVDMLLNQYDPSGVIPVIYAKGVFRHLISALGIDLWKDNADVDAEMLADARTLYTEFYSEPVMEAEREYVDSLQCIIDAITDNLVLGEHKIDKELENAADMIQRVYDAVSHFAYESYLQGSSLAPIKKFDSKVSVYPTLAQCVCALESAEDGMYLCYIGIPRAKDGYWGFFVKNNGSLLSFNDRPDNQYFGSSRDMTSSLFPYKEMADFFNEGNVQGIADDELDMRLMLTDYVPIALAMLLISRRLAAAGKADAPFVYIDSLLPINLQAAQQSDPTGAIAALGRSQTAARMKSFSLDFTAEDVMTGKMNPVFNADNSPEASFREKGKFPPQTEGSYMQRIIDAYGQDFTADAAHLCASDSYKRMFYSESADTDGSCAVSAAPELVGSYCRMQMAFYWKARRQLAQHIEKRMLQDYISFGGADAAQLMWSELLLAKKAELERICASLYQSEAVSQANEIGRGSRKHCAAKYQDIPVSVYRNTFGFLPFEYRECKTIIFARGADEDAAGCDSGNDKGCITWFAFSPANCEQMERLAGRELPNIFKGWTRGAFEQDIWSRCSGVVDCVSKIEPPLYALHMKDGEYGNAGLGENVNFDFILGFTQERLKEVMEQLS